MFKNRKEAGEILAGKLLKLNSKDTIVLAVPRGGVPVGFEVARLLQVPLEPIMIKKIGHPANKEYAIGATSMDEFFIASQEHIPKEYIDAELVLIRKRLTEMYSKFMGQKKPTNLKGMNVILVDDGMATGHTMMATLHVVKKSLPNQIIVAIPVASNNAVKLVKTLANVVVCIYIPDEFYGVGSFYEDFDQLTDKEVIGFFNQ
ncbi:MAG: phosphoribosyltransferase [Saprospiraceae bacterium]|nr:phosphoribosyltransferase [Saprospiraceae bacterium]MBK7437703.1 phosphoribosyltransferase [Saprospiraceae bacterium]MBK7608825.1 phosphoribosyltransferase [Saprospiraceae bacterium]MBK8512247.1 phosphoribosyltransferase [Saprospiraceae bacterium]MBK8779727.1 phosphoribosyltransferase [Saprospiraceae bacterium]